MTVAMTSVKEKESDAIVPLGTKMINITPASFGNWEKSFREQVTQYLKRNKVAMKDVFKSGRVMPSKPSKAISSRIAEEKFILIFLTIYFMLLQNFISVVLVYLLEMF